MKKVLFFTLEMQGLQEASQLQAANECIAQGDEILYLTCGRALGFCNDNRKGNSLQCKFCKKRQMVRTVHFLQGSVTVSSIDNYVTPQMVDQADAMDFSFQSMEELKSITFDGIEIGYGALSSYVSYTRNIEAPISHIKSYIEDMLRMQVRMIFALKELIASFQPTLIVFHNGRFAEYKPLLGLARKLGIDFLCTENILLGDGNRYQDNYCNGIPHNVYDRDLHVKELWNCAPDMQQREQVARSFFENRRNAKYAGDTIYVKDQKEGMLPADWDDKKENIVIFNSSEDEFFAIGSDCGANALFKSQIEGIKTIVEHYVSDTNKHFTLRVHPHLKGLPFAYHQDLYKLKYPNLTVIPADSVVSSYSLMDAASKIVVFGSTMGVESTYWHKPVINMAFATYNLMDVVYIPQNENELWSLIDNKELKPKEVEHTFPYGYFVMTNRRPQLDTVKELTNRKTLSLWGNKYIYHSGYKLLGSEHLYGIWRALMYRYEGLVPGLCKYKKIPT